MAIPVGVQLYTVREEMNSGLEKVFDEIASIGLKGVELWFKGEFPKAEDLSRMLRSSGLEAFSAHVPFLDLRDKTDEVCEYHGRIGNSNLAIPNIPADLRGSSENWKKRVEEIGRIAEKAASAGFTLHYHNHTHEFDEKVDGAFAHDYIFGQLSTELLMAELDTCFIKKVGEDPAEYIRKYSDRMTLLHVKDASRNPDIVDTWLGNGIVDWDAVFAAVRETNVEWLIMEQGHHEEGAYTSMRNSWKLLEDAGLV
jgi:sugar phosphate isomerase/epimerase